MDMEALSPILGSFHLVTILMISGAFGVQIQLFKQEDFTGLRLESNSSAECNNIPRDKVLPIYSIRTDTCLIVYTGWDCKSRWTAKFMPGNIYVSANQIGRRGLIYSFHICNENEGDNELNVDLTKHYEFNNVLESYKKVCSCVNVPQYVQNMATWSINNHHNDIMAYYEPDCSEKKWKSTVIAAGHNDGSNNAYFHKMTDSETNLTYKIQSFGPNPNSPDLKTSCKLEALSNKFVEPQKQFDHLNRKQEIIQSEILKQQNYDFTELAKTIADLFRNFTLSKNI